MSKFWRQAYQAGGIVWRLLISNDVERFERERAEYRLKHGIEKVW